MFEFGSANDDQKQVIVTTEGPVLTIAGPGTGKTFTLVKRIAYLVMEKNVQPGEIMVVTFTEKAAKELLTRISNEFLKYDVNINMNEMYIGTFHSVCLRLMKENSEYIEGVKQSRMMDAFEQTYLVCKNLDNFNRLAGINKHIPGSMGVWKQSLEICRYVNQMMEELVDLDAMEADKDEDIRFLARLVNKYDELLANNNAMDFASIQTDTYRMFQVHPEVLKNVQDNIRYIMVDEYQDTNYIQEQLVFLLAGDRKNICVVGDDDQGMYRFRGATIRNILEFPDKFDKGECTIVHLNKNYRSEPGIIEFYNNWMESVDGINLFNWDKYRYEKQIVAGKNDVRLDKAVYYCGGDSVNVEKEDLLQLLRQLKRNGNITDYNQVAFLFRSVKSEEATTIGAYLEENGIPVYSPRSDMFFEREEVKQVLGCFIICFSTYMQDLKQNNFLYKISDELRQYYISCVKAAMVLMKSDNGLHDFIEMQMKEIQAIEGESEIGLLDILYKLLAYKPFKTYLDASLNDNVLKTRAARNLSEISRMIARFNFLQDMHNLSENNKIAMPEEFFNLYLKYLYVDGIGEYEDESEYAPGGCVSFMTIHQSKGLEFPVVVVGSLGNTPRRNSDPLMYSAESRFFNRAPYEPMADIKYFDFWRLYYVAFSRAQNLLVLATKKDDSKYFGMYLDNVPHVQKFKADVAFDEVKKVNYKHVYSFTSHIAVYDGCPTQYKFYKEYAFAQNQMFHTSVGSLVHATLEDMNKCIIAGHLEKVTEGAIKEWFYMNYQSMQEQTGYFLTDEQQGNALSQVVRYYQHRKDELGKVWRAEEEINLVLPEYILQGVIDLVEGEGNTVEIVDYKTGPKPNIEGHPERVEHYRKQLEIYAYLIEKRYGKKVNRMHLYYTSTLEGNPLISFEWSRDAIDKTVQEITQIVRDIEDKKFDSKVQNNYACRFCDTCKQTVYIEKICDKIMEYKPGTGENELWDRMASELYGSYNFKNIIFALTDDLPTPRKEYRRILCMAGESTYIAKNSRNWLCETYEICKNTHGLSEMELNRVKGLVMDALYKDYLFARAEEMAAEIMQSEELPKQAYLTLAEFYTKTRRYDEADEILSDAGKIFAGEESMQVSIRNLAEDNAKQREKADSGKQEYMPNPKENRDEVRKNYVEFLASIGIEAEIPVAGTKTRKAPKPIPKDQYPNPVEIREANFDSFVAFDLETTGKSSKIDSIIEFGAIKVVNGQVVDSQEFTFQKFVKPYKRKLSEEVQQLTGITEDDLKDAGEMWEVTPEFMEFVGDNVLVGFNCIAFDSRFMVRAGRYSNIIIENKYFDVLRYTNRFSEQLGIDAKKCSLKELCEKLDVENPRAHTALADAITTAQVYLKLKAMDTGAENVSMDDMLADIEDW